MPGRSSGSLPILKLVGSKDWSQGEKLGQGFGQSQRVETSTSLRVDPRVVLASYLLQLNQAELDQALETELNENPALERLQDDTEPIHDEAILQSVAPHELRPS